MYQQHTITTLAGDWRILNRVERGKQIELTFAVDPNSDKKLKSVGHRLCYGFGQVIVRQRSKHSAEAKDAPTATAPVPAKTAQTPVLSQEVPSCSQAAQWQRQQQMPLLPPLSDQRTTGRQAAPAPIWSAPK
ncbi:hypothetical protein ACLKA6_012848 [Drosophila palustris]